MKMFCVSQVGLISSTSIQDRYPLLLTQILPHTYTLFRWVFTTPSLSHPLHFPKENNFLDYWIRNILRVHSFATYGTILDISHLHKQKFPKCGWEWVKGPTPFESHTLYPPTLSIKPSDNIRKLQCKVPLNLNPSRELAIKVTYHHSVSSNQQVSHLILGVKRNLHTSISLTHLWLNGSTLLKMA